MKKIGFAGLLVAALAVALPAVANAKPLVVGGKDFTEQEILTSMTSQYLKALGYDVDERSGLGSAAVRQAQESGQVDLYWEYTGTSLITYNGIRDKFDAAETFKKVKDLDAAKGLTWLQPSKANDTYAIAMRQDEAKQKGIKSISDLAAKINGGDKLTFASNAEFYARPDGLAPLEKAYGFQFGRPNIMRMDTGLVYQALRDGQVDTGLVFATDGRVPAFHFVILADDKGYFPDYAIVPVVRTDTLQANPKLAEQMDKLSALLSDPVMARLNAEIDVDKKPVEEVAKSFLVDNKLIKG